MILLISKSLKSFAEKIATFPSGKTANKALSSEKSVVLKPNLTPPKFPKKTVKEKLKVQNNSEEIKPIKKDFKVGDKVKLKSNGSVAVIKSINDKKIEILVGNFVIKTKLSEIKAF